MKTFMNVFLKSLQNEETGCHALGEAQLETMKGNTAIFMTETGVRCTGTFNPFLGRYFVDDIFGICDERGEKK